MFHSRPGRAAEEEKFLALTELEVGFLCFVEPLTILTTVSWIHIRKLCCIAIFPLNLLKPTGHVMHQQFNIQQLYALCFVFI